MLPTCVCPCDCIHMDERGPGGRASCVAVVIVVVGVDASLIPVNGPLGLNRRGVFFCGPGPSFIHFIHVPRGSGGGVGGGWRTLWHGVALFLFLPLPLAVLAAHVSPSILASAGFSRQASPVSSSVVIATAADDLSDPLGAPPDVNTQTKRPPNFFSPPPTPRLTDRVLTRSTRP